MKPASTVATINFLLRCRNLANYVVNDGDDSLGEDSPATYAQLRELVDSWYPNNTRSECREQANMIWNRLPDAEDWLRSLDESDWEAYFDSLGHQTARSLSRLSDKISPYVELLYNSAWLRLVAQTAVGLHYNSPRAKKILNIADWTQFYPLVDNDGRITGGICGSDEKGFGNVDDEAMIDLDNLRGGQKYDENQGYVQGIPAYRK